MTVLGLALAACTTAPSLPAASVETATPAQPGAVVVGCTGIEAAECSFVAARVAAALPAGRHNPFSIQVMLFGCVNHEPCPKSLGARVGRAIADYADGGEPIEVRLAGPPAAPKLESVEGSWSGPIQPVSPLVAGPGPFEFEVGHCGLSHMVDFNGSFWVPVGQVDGEGQAVINAERGSIRLLDPNLAEYRGTADFAVRLARFPGAKRFWLCD